MDMNEKCVFCGRPASEARFMVKGPGDKNLCNDCISVVSIIANQAMLSMDNIEVGGDPWGDSEPPDEDYEGIFDGEEFPFSRSYKKLRLILQSASVCVTVFP